MDMLKEIYRATSTNGNYGVSIVAENKVNMNVPQQGTMYDLGSVSGMKVFKFVHGETGQWYITGDDMVPLKGCETIYHTGLQSNNMFDLLVGGNFFIVKEFGYKRRGSRIYVYQDGKRIDIPESVLLAAQLIEGDTVKEVKLSNEPTETVFGAKLAIALANYNKE